MDLLRQTRDYAGAGVVFSEYKQLTDEHSGRADSPIKMILFDSNENEICLLSEIWEGEIPEGVEVVWRGR
jgi:hypothetical protein